MKQNNFYPIELLLVHTYSDEQYVLYFPKNKLHDILANIVKILIAEEAILPYYGLSTKMVCTLMEKLYGVKYSWISREKCIYKNIHSKMVTSIVNNKYDKRVNRGYIKINLFWLDENYTSLPLTSSHIIDPVLLIEVRNIMMSTIISDSLLSKTDKTILLSYLNQCDLSQINLTENINKTSIKI